MDYNQRTRPDQCMAVPVLATPQKYYWVHLQIEVGDRTYRFTTAINAHPFVFEKDMNEMSKKKVDEANARYYAIMKARKYPSVYYLVSWKEITKEEYELHQELHKEEEHV